MKKLLPFIAAFAAILVTLAEWCGLDRLIATGSSKRTPSNRSTIQQETIGLAFFARRVRRKLALAWLPVAAVLAVGLALASPAGIGLAAVGAAMVAGGQMAGVLGVAIAFVVASAFAAGVMRAPRDGHVYTATLTTPQLLLDVYGAFRKWFPALAYIGTEFRGAPLKLNQKYIAHIASYGSASTYDATTGYANGANTARNGLVDVPVVVDQQPTYPLKWLHLDEIKDIKNKYDRVMEGAGYVLGKGAFDNGIAGKMTTRYFSQENVTAVADCDYDWLMTLQTVLNGNGVAPTGRVLLVNSSVAAVLGADPRMISKDFAGQLVSGQGYRQWTNIAGFALIQEYPDLPTNNVAGLTTVSAAASTDLCTKTAHGLETGDPVVISAIAGGAAGLATATRYWAIKASSSTFKLATTYANAIAGTAIDITSDSSGAGLSLALKENLIAFACDARAFGYLSGIPEGFRSDLAQQLGITPTMTFENGPMDPASGITMGVAKWMEVGTGNLFWCPTFVYGTNAGKQGDTAVAGNTASANSILAAANLAGVACDYAGLRISSGT